GSGPLLASDLSGQVELRRLRAEQAGEDVLLSAYVHERGARRNVWVEWRLSSSSRAVSGRPNARTSAAISGSSPATNSSRRIEPSSAAWRSSRTSRSGSSAAASRRVSVTDSKNRKRSPASSSWGV